MMGVTLTEQTLVTTCEASQSPDTSMVENPKGGELKQHLPKAVAAHSGLTARHCNDLSASNHFHS
jgi:hypothetical protein